MAAEPFFQKGARAQKHARNALQLAIPMAITLALFYAGDLGLIPSSGPLAWLAAFCAALLMGTALVGMETSHQ